MSNDKYRIGDLLDIIDSAVSDDENNGEFDVMMRDQGNRYLEGFNAGINYVKAILVGDMQ